MLSKSIHVVVDGKILLKSLQYFLDLSAKAKETKAKHKLMGPN